MARSDAGVAARKVRENKRRRVDALVKSTRLAQRKSTR